MAGALTAAIAAAFSGGGSPPVVTDQYFEYTTLLLPGNGTNGAQNNTFLDGSTNNFTITRNGNTTQGTFSPFSQTGWGNYFDGTGDYLSAGSNAAWAMGTGDFSVEFWTYPTVLGADGGYVSASYTTGFHIAQASGTLYFWVANSQINATSALSVNQWQHVVCTRASGTSRIFVNGVLKQTGANTNSVSQNSLYIGTSSHALTEEITGYMSDVRIVKGQIPTTYTTSSTTIGAQIFTPPTSPLTTSSQGVTASNTSLLTCQSNRFVDNSNNNVTLTITGTPSVQAFSPFNPTASWSAATNGGSGYFDGNGDYLTFGPTASIGTSAFTIEAWVYLTATPTSRGLWGTNTSANGGFTIRINSTTQIALDVTGGGGTNFTVPTINLNEWVHIACVRDGSNNTTVFTNGVRSSSGALTVTTNFSYLAGLGLIFPGTTNPPTGYIASARILTGSAVYDPTQTTCTVPTAPLTAISGTQFLCNFTNAGIYDATSKNDLETVGNAQISTTQSKWGGSSMAFDGTGDYVTSYNANALFRIGNIYTIELWFYTTTIAAGAAGLICLATGASTNSGINIYRSGSEIICNDGATGGTGPSSGSSAITANTWAHLAVVSDGSTTKMYIDGVLKGTYSGTTASSAALTYVTVGANGDKSSVLNGYIQDARITKGIARYTTNFTPPTAAFPTL